MNKQELREAYQATPEFKAAGELWEKVKKTKEYLSVEERTAFHPLSLTLDDIALFQATDEWKAFEIAGDLALATKECKAVQEFNERQYKTQDYLDWMHKSAAQKEGQNE